MQLPQITQQDVRKFAQNPKNSLLIPCIFLGNALPYFFQKLAHSAYIDIINRSAFAALDYSLTDRLTPAIHIQGDKIRAAFGSQIDRLLSDLDASAKCAVELTLSCFGLDLKNLLSDEALVKTALTAATLATALFATSALTGSGILPLFWAYQHMRIVRALAAFAIDIYQFPNNYPWAWRVMTWTRELLSEA